MNAVKSGLLWVAVAAWLWVLAGLAHSENREAALRAEGFHPIHSRIFDGVRYDDRTRTLTLLFDSGACYAFHDVPRDVFLDLTRIVNPGEYFNSCIRGIYTYERVDRVAPEWAAAETRM